jgi:hypothetical protein
LIFFYKRHVRYNIGAYVEREREKESGKRKNRREND